MYNEWNKYLTQPLGNFHIDNLRKNNLEFRDIFDNHKQVWCKVQKVFHLTRQHRLSHNARILYLRLWKYILRVWECVDHSVILISFFFNDCYVPLAQLVGSVSCKMTQVMMCIQFILEQQVLWKNVSCLRSEEFCGRRFPGVASKTTNFPAP